MSELKPCPFCGGKARIIICDDEGNHRPEEYALDPWSGLQYMLAHDERDAVGDCPIAAFRGESIGTWQYDTRDEAIEAWNNRSVKLEVIK